jgi:hypothetical protein
LAKLVAGVILVGNLSFPVLVTAGLVDDDNRKCPVGDVECLEKEAKEH